MDAIELESKAKYRKWFEREMLKGYKREDIVPTALFFENNSTKFEQRDIFKWDAKELEDYIKEHNLCSARQERESDKANAVKLFEDNDWLVVRPNDAQSCTYYGKGTKWCITMTTGNYFESYRDQNYTFHIVVDKKAEEQSKWGKVCVAIKRDEENKPEKIEVFSSDDVAYSIDKLPDRLRNFLQPDAK